MNDRGRVEEPSVCQSCHKRWGERLIHNRSAFFDKQIIKLQVNPSCSILPKILLAVQRVLFGEKYSL